MGLEAFNGLVCIFLHLFLEGDLHELPEYVPLWKQRLWRRFDTISLDVDRATLGIYISSFLCFAKHSTVLLQIMLCRKMLNEKLRPALDHHGKLCWNL